MLQNTICARFEDMKTNTIYHLDTLTNKVIETNMSRNSKYQIQIVDALSEERRKMRSGKNSLRFICASNLSVMFYCFYCFEANALIQQPSLKLYIFLYNHNVIIKYNKIINNFWYHLKYAIHIKFPQLSQKYIFTLGLYKSRSKQGPHIMFCFNVS